MDIVEINKIQQEAKAIFTLLQQLQAPMTEQNIVILNGCLGSLKLIGKICEEAKKKEKTEDPAEEVNG